MSLTQKLIKARVNSGVPWNSSQLFKSRMLFLEVLFFFYTFCIQVRPKIIDLNDTSESQLLL